MLRAPRALAPTRPAAPRALRCAPFAAVRAATPLPPRKRPLQPSLLRPRRFSPRAAALRTRLESSLQMLPALLRSTTIPQRTLAGALSGAGILFILRFHAILRAATPPALALAAAGWVMAHERRVHASAFIHPHASFFFSVGAALCARALTSARLVRASRSRAALEADLAVLLFPQRPRAAGAAPLQLRAGGDEGAEEDESEEGYTSDVDDEEVTGPWDGNYESHMQLGGSVSARVQRGEAAEGNGGPRPLRDTHPNRGGGTKRH